MASSYAQAVKRLYELGHELHGVAAARKFDLEHMRVLLRALGDPQRQFRPVLIAGTNGKGSTAATLASIVYAAGHRTALYTSPHLVRVNERIRVLEPGDPNGRITDDAFARVYDHVEAAAQRLVAAGELPWHPSFFEMLTAMAFLHFASVAVELAVLEAGMGGRLDATNVVEPLVSVITDISLDHQKFLGNTLSEIAAEKAGIIRPGGVVVTLPQHPEANDVIGNAIVERGARAVSAVPYVPPPSAGRPYALEVRGERMLIDSPLYGAHQVRNVALAIATAEELNGAGIHISPHDIAAGIRETRWPGRFEVIAANPAQRRPEMVLDVAHNPAGAWALRAALSERYLQGGAPRPLVFVFGAMRDKAIREIAQILFPLAQHVVATRAHNPRSAEPGEIRELSDGIISSIRTTDNVGEAVEHACALAGQAGVVVVTGSIYIVGEAVTDCRSQFGFQNSGRGNAPVSI
ncbi:MAG: folylpolyglutamate synthase/dihydrofolate synthase family protein [Terriglobales bacterium]